MCSESSLISAISNDISYADIFLFQAKRFMQKGDVLILISSSGNSKNIIKVLNYCNKRKIKTIGLTNFSGGVLKKKCNISIHTNVFNYGIGEDANHIIMHFIMQYLSMKNLKTREKKIII